MMKRKFVTPGCAKETERRKVPSRRRPVSLGGDCVYPVICLLLLAPHPGTQESAASYDVPSSEPPTFRSQPVRRDCFPNIPDPSTQSTPPSFLPSHSSRPFLWPPMDQDQDETSHNSIGSLGVQRALAWISER